MKDLGYNEKGELSAARKRIIDEEKKLGEESKEDQPMKESKHSKGSKIGDSSLDSIEETIEL